MSVALNHSETHRKLKMSVCSGISTDLCSIAGHGTFENISLLPVSSHFARRSFHVKSTDQVEQVADSSECNEVL
jgi:hypothetical protein